ncbi:MAG TPA: hypothetical protein VEK34_04085 [Methylocella sp.]|nr:hypothetical protein [Methylocella sp.]
MGRIFHSLAFLYGSWLTDIIERYTARRSIIGIFGRNWVKGIDYLYLSISAVGVVKIVVGAVTTAQGSAEFNAIATILLGIAIAMRITRTSIEIFEWDKAPANRAANWP